MKSTPLFVALTLAFAAPSAFANTELENLRSRCTEQERQIRMLENENARLRGHERSASEVPINRQTVSTTTAITSSSGTYTVKAGDSFAKISRKVGTTPEKLADMNGLKLTSIIRPGQSLKVPATAAAKPKSSDVVAVPTNKSSVATSLSGKTHKVQAGETFSSISKKHGLSTASLLAANPKVKPSALRPGQSVNLSKSAENTSAPMPSAVAKAPVTKTPVARPPQSQVKAPIVSQNIPVSTAAPTRNSPAPVPAALPTAPAKEAPAPAPVPATADNKIRPITVDGEMTYGDFAAKYGTDTARLNALNGLDLTTATVLAKGSELYVPPAQP